MGNDAVAAGRSRRRLAWSLRARLYVLGIVAIGLAWLGGGVATYLSAAKTNQRLRQQTLINLAQSILAVAQHEEIVIHMGAGGQFEGVETFVPGADGLASRYAYQIRSLDGRLLFRSANAPADRSLAPAGVQGLQVVDDLGRPADGERMVYVLRSPPAGMEIQTADQGGDELLSTLAPGQLAAGLIVSVLPAVLITWLLFRSALAPLREFSNELRQRTPQALEPLAVHDPPRELEPVLASVNDLMARVADALSQERSFTALAAHELRTPMAALGALAHLAAQGGPAPEQREILQQIERQVSLCARLLNQLLTLARVEARPAVAVKTGPVPLNELLAEVLAEIADDAAERRIEVACDLAVVSLVGDSFGIRLILRNLLENALRHSPDDGLIRVSSRPSQQGVLLRVEDGGPGIPEQERSRVLQRFYRGSQAVGAGSGLGLAIVSNVADAHGARILMGTSDLGGLRVDIDFPQGAAAHRSVALAA